MAQKLKKNLFLIFLTCCNAINQELFFKSSFTPINVELVNAVSFIIHNVFFKRFSTINVITAVENPSDARITDFKDLLLNENQGLTIYRLDNNSHIQNIRNRPKFYNIILVDKFENFEILYDKIQPDKFNFRGFYLIVLTEKVLPEISFIFQAMLKKSIINVNLIYDEGNIIKMVTFNIFSATSCSQLTIEKPIIFHNGTFATEIDEIYPDKVRNLQKCDVRIVTFHRCPAVCVSKNSRGKLIAKGFDIGIIELIAEKLNFKVKKEILRGDEQWGTIFEDGSTTGAITKILEGDADIAIGNYLLRASRINIMDSSVVYFSFPLVFAIPPGAKFSQFEKLLRPFQLVVWILLVAFLTVGVFVIILIRFKFKFLMDFVYGTGIKHPINNMLIAIFGGVQSKLPRRNFSRFLLMMFLLFCLVKRNVYQGSLYIILKSDG